MPTARGSLAVATASNGKIYAIGGQTTAELGAVVVEEYDPDTDAWQTKSPLREDKYGLARIGAANGKVYVVGGWPTP